MALNGHEHERKHRGFKKTLLLWQAFGINNDCSVVVLGAYYNVPTNSAFLLTLDDPN
jgi:hypothetical protein